MTVASSSSSSSSSAAAAAQTPTTPTNAKTVTEKLNKGVKEVQKSNTTATATHFHVSDRFVDDTELLVAMSHEDEDSDDTSIVHRWHIDTYMYTHDAYNTLLSEYGRYTTNFHIATFFSLTCA
jgi:hypothetical protein